jgi:hypothetical protein
MLSDIQSGIALFKSMYESAKALKDINDALARDGVVADLLEKILAARQAQLELTEHITQLEKQIAAFETWETEKQRYELKGMAGGGLAYALKESESALEPAHHICASCYQSGKKSILQPKPYSIAAAHLGKPQTLVCNGCKAEVIV